VFRGHRPVHAEQERGEHQSLTCRPEVDDVVVDLCFDPAQEAELHWHAHPPNTWQ
jgi:hypothetical protein